VRLTFASETMLLIEARDPWFCIGTADITPAKRAPAVMPTPPLPF
jgi:hypothetical protein